MREHVYKDVYEESSQSNDNNLFVRNSNRNYRFRSTFTPVHSLVAVLCKVKAKIRCNSFCFSFSLFLHCSRMPWRVRSREREQGISNHFFLSFHYYFVLFYFYGILKGRRTKEKKNQSVFFCVCFTSVVSWFLI